MNRRDLLQRSAAALCGALTGRGVEATPRTRSASAGIAFLRIHGMNVELAPGISVPALGCNDTLTGPMIQRSSNEPVTIDVTNDTNRRIFMISPGIDRTLDLAAGARLQSTFPANSSRFACARVSFADDLPPSISGVAGMYVQDISGDMGDQVFPLTLHHWEPSHAPGSGPLLGPGLTYRYATLGDKLLEAAEPIRVRRGQRVHFRFFNASPGKCVTLSLPKHRFRVSALDGYPVSRRCTVDHLALGPGERVDATVDMTTPGRFVLGSVDRRDRDAGFGRIVEYANAKGAPLHPRIEASTWDYGAFGTGRPASAADVALLSVALNPVRGNRYRFARLAVEAGRRYRLGIINATGERTCVALRGHPFEVALLAGNWVGGVVKDTIALPTFARTEIDFVAADSSVELWHAADVSVTV